jgi:hypothetical protein
VGRAGLCALVLGCGPADTIGGALHDEGGPAPLVELGDPNATEDEELDPSCVAPNLGALRAEVFVPACGVAGCHSGGSPAEGLDLTMDETALLARLRQPASQSPSGIPLIAPGSAGGSYLYLKVYVKTPLIGERMPRDAEPLDDCAVESLRRFIMSAM